MDTTNRALILHAAHDLRVGSAPPAHPGPGEVAIAMSRGGICGSDLHYYHDGGFGLIRVREPIILGHELAGTVTEVGQGVSHVKAGDRVAINPSLPCGLCRFCTSGRPIHCTSMQFFGSAMRYPHVQGGFRQHLVCSEAQAIPTGNETPPEIAAFAEPLAVCLHAIRQAGSVAGAKVLITGSGPIGALTLLAARHAGARDIAVTDIAVKPLEMALRLGADATINVKDAPDALEDLARDKGQCDIAFECSGTASGLAQAISCVQPRGTIVQIGLASDLSIPIAQLAAKEITLLGSFRFDTEFAWAVELLRQRLINVIPLLTATIPFDNPRAAFELASDRSQAMKVQLAFD
jgi:L-idonate 5-dehydrogenase